ncbi:MAG: hypothetical protein NTZ05_16495 [Chloroflexi bacterium]|nr:hypothetical protein [Chloroflexota bacterium]
MDLASGTVQTIAGTGKQQLGTPQEGPARGALLTSPWDLWLDGDLLIIAMAGSHQLWAIDLATGVMQLYAGSAHEGITDGPAAAAWMAQPSGLASIAAFSTWRTARPAPSAKCPWAAAI